MADETTMYVRRKNWTNDVFEFIDFREYADAEWEKVKMRTVLKEDNKKDLKEAIEILTKQIDEWFLQKEKDKFVSQLEMIEAYENLNPIEEVKPVEEAVVEQPAEQA